MSHPHVPEEELDDAVALYRDALETALEEFDVDADRDTVIAAARRILGEDDPDALDTIVTVANSDYGDHVWHLEEELVDDRLDADFDEKFPSDGNED